MVLSVPAPADAPCANWATQADLLNCDGCRGETYEDEVLDLYLDVATEALWRKSGRQFNPGCALTLRPCCRDALCAYGDSWWHNYGYPYAPAIVNGQWYNLSPGYSGCVAYECGTALARLDLGVSPVTELTAVKIDGAALNPSKYAVQGNRWLIRTDGLLWPTAQDVTLPDSAVGTWSVAFKYGQPPSPMAKQAAAQLACEFTRLFHGDKNCALPLRATGMSRQGVTYSLVSVMDVLDRGKTGLYFVDLFLDSVNPHRLDRPPRVLSPDVGRSHRRA